MGFLHRRDGFQLDKVSIIQELKGQRQKDPRVQGPTYVTEQDLATEREGKRGEKYKKKVGKGKAPKGNKELGG